MFYSKEHSAHQDDSGTETTTKKSSDDKSAKKGGAPASVNAPKDAAAKSATGKETRAGNHKTANYCNENN